MRIVVFACWIALLTGCKTGENKMLPKVSEPEKSSKYAGILAKCKAITIDTLKVFSLTSMGAFNTGDSTYPFSGEWIDSADEALFPPDVVAGAMGNSSGIFACDFFAIDSSHTGIIVRTPTLYESTSIKLFILDNKRDTLTGFTELAERWNDGGEDHEVTSWLYRNNKKLNAYIWVHEVYDRSEEDSNSKAIDTYNHYYVLDLSKAKPDTISSDAGNLLKTFQAVAGKKDFE